MRLLEALTEIMSSLGLPVETGIFSDVAPDEYVVLTPLTDTFDVFADNLPEVDVQEIRISLFSKGNYTRRKKQITTAALENGMTVTGRHYAGYDGDTGYHNFALDVAKEFMWEEKP